MSVQVFGDLRCPSCHKNIDGSEAFSNPPKRAAPIPGDLCVCVYCAHILRFVTHPLGLALREIVDSDYAEIPTEMLVDLAKARSAVLASLWLRQSANASLN